MQYPWPGNVRELRNILERIILTEDGDTLTLEHFQNIGMQSEVIADDLSKKSVEQGGLDYNEVTLNLIREALKITHGNVSEAARLMNIPPHKLRYRIKKYGLLKELG